MGFRTSLVVQWLRIHLPMQRTQVRSLVQEDPTCHGATSPFHHNHEPVLQSPGAKITEATHQNEKGHCNKKPEHHNCRVASVQQ